MNATSVNRRLAKIALSLVTRSSPEPLKASSGRFLDEAAQQDAEADSFYVYLYGVIAGWYLLALVAGLLMVALAYVGDLAAGDAGRAAALVGGVGVTFFCIAGAADATWRSLIVYSAKRRRKRLGTADARVRVELGIARLDYPVLTIQVAIGVIAAVVAALRL
jgi:hypothetical protein